MHIFETTKMKMHVVWDHKKFQHISKWNILLSDSCIFCILSLTSVGAWK